MSPPASALIVGGRGADTIVICSLREASVALVVGELDTDGGDGAADLIVVEPEVFLGVPPGVTLQIVMQGLSPAQDRIRLRLPPGITPEFGPNLFTTLRAGPVAIMVVLENAMPSGPGIFEIVQAAPAYQPAWAVPAQPFTGYDPGLTCAAAPPAAAAPSQVTPAYLPYKQAPLTFYGPSASPLRIEADADEWVQTSDAADRLLLFGGEVVSAGAGADQIVVCGMAGIFGLIAAGPGGLPGLDLDADTIVIEAGRLQDAPRSLEIVNLNPINDRIVLRLPPGLEPQFVREEYDQPHVQVGMLRITTLAQVWERGFDVELDPSLFALDRVPAP